MRTTTQTTDKRLACIVNDVAQINIDAKFIRSSTRSANERPLDANDGTKTTADLADTLELSNGCACCRWAALSCRDTIYAIVVFS